MAVTDSLQVLPIQTSPDIHDVLPIAKSGIPCFSGIRRYPLETGIRFRAYTGTGNKSQSGLMHVFQLQPKKFSMAWSDEQGVFTVGGLAFYDSTAFLIKPANARTALAGRYSNSCQWILRRSALENRFTIQREKQIRQEGFGRQFHQAIKMLNEVSVMAESYGRRMNLSFVYAGLLAHRDMLYRARTSIQQWVICCWHYLASFPD